MVTEQRGRPLDSNERVASRTGATPRVDGPSISRAAFSLAFGRSFNRVYSYVNRRIDDRATCERVVKEILVANLALLIEKDDDKDSVWLLKASADRLIQRETAPESAVPDA